MVYAALILMQPCHSRRYTKPWGHFVISGTESLSSRKQPLVIIAAASADEARAALRDAPGVVLLDRTADEGYVTPSECAGEDPVYVSRVREDPTIENGLSLWVVADNLRKGAALNTVQIAEELIRSYIEKAA